MPEDPGDGSPANTGYSIEVDTNNIITVSADDAENSEVIQVSR
jgi:hypothetical protein